MSRHSGYTILLTVTAKKGRAVARVVDAVAAALARVPVRKGELILLGLSGGPDSVALTHALHTVAQNLGYRLAAAHLNHRLRGTESDRDERFVHETCGRLGLDLIVERTDGLGPDTPNLEERARELRHSFLNRTADRLGASHIALAHHADDQAETVLMRLLRGAGMAGLGAMAEAGPGRLIRPLLGVSRVALLAYLNAIGARFVTDSTNLSTTPQRNRVRNELLPMLEREYAPGLRGRLAALSSELRSVHDFLAFLARNELKARLEAGGALGIGGFEQLHPGLAAMLIREFVRDGVGNLRRIERAHVEAMRRLCVAGLPNGVIELPGGWQMRREYQRVFVEHPRPCAHSAFAVELARDGETLVADACFVFRASTFEARPGIAMPACLSEALFDADRIDQRLIVRNFVRGDRIRPLGMKGDRKLTDIFIDKKLPRERRANWPLVVSGDEIIWIPELVRSGAALVTPATRTILRVKARDHVLRDFVVACDLTRVLAF
jgi:tRNA(Ile)-lysidine synthase